MKINASILIAKTRRFFENLFIAVFIRKNGQQSARWNGIKITESKYDPYVREILFGSLRRWKQQEKIYQKLIRSKDPIIFDIGANIGFVSVIFSKISGSTVYSFEPVFQTFNFLEKNISQNKLLNVKPFMFGFSDMEERCYIGIPSNLGFESDKYRSRKSGLYSVYAEEKIKDTNGIGEVAFFSTLDIFCSQNDIKKIDFIKIDVEGHELPVLHGGVETLRKFQPVLQIENHPRVMRMAKRTSKVFFDFFDSISYTVSVFESDKFVKMNFDSFDRLYSEVPVELYCFPHDKNHVWIVE